jgi:hypothetical protein
MVYELSLPECLWWPAECWTTPVGVLSEVVGHYQELKNGPGHADPERPKSALWETYRANMRASPTSEHSELQGTDCKAVQHENGHYHA